MNFGRRIRVETRGEARRETATHVVVVCPKHMSDIKMHNVPLRFGRSVIAEPKRFMRKVGPPQGDFIRRTQGSKGLDDAAATWASCCERDFFIFSSSFFLYSRSLRLSTTPPQTPAGMSSSVTITASPAKRCRLLTG